jgi:hypothetical protein
LTRLVAVLIAAAALLLSSGCGGGEGVDEGATVTVYVAASLCAGAELELEDAGGRAGSVRVEVRCLPGTRGNGRLDLAAIGANARRATEDSTTIAYIGEPDPAATRFSAPILAEADIAQIPGTSGAATMAKLLDALDQAEGAADLRSAVSDDLAGS